VNEIEKRPSDRHYPAIDGLRGVAALMIVWHHFLQLCPMHGVVLSFLSRVFGFSWVGVDLFFALSGFLITGILTDSKLKKHYFRSFYGRRILRIFPLYYGLLVLAFFVLPLIGAGAHVPQSSRIFFWTYTSNFYFEVTGWTTDNYLSHLWTLAIEEQFYLVWPLVIFFVTSKETLRSCLLWAFLSISLIRCILFFAGVDFNALYLNTVTHCDALILGGYLALSVRSRMPGALKGLRPCGSVVASMVIVTLFLADFGGFVPGWDALPEMAFSRSVLMFSFLAILFVWLIYVATNQSSGRIFHFFSHPILRWFGKYSYALYVLHVPLAFLILRSQVSWLSSVPSFAELELFFLYFGGCILSAFLSWHLYEKHFLKLKRYFPRNEPDITFYS
jgi:peptidoglycan/LPS O-acetylase OafA/YrhL